METYTLNLCYALYYTANVTVTVEKGDIDAAFDAAMKVNTDQWEACDEFGPTFVTAIARGALDSAYNVANDDDLSALIPRYLTEQGAIMSDYAVLKRADDLIESIALRFLEQLREDIGGLAYRHWLRQTRSNRPPRGICYSHEYCDANETMLLAHKAVFGELWDLDMQDETQCRMWSYAWDRAIELAMAGKGPQA